MRKVIKAVEIVCLRCGLNKEEKEVGDKCKTWGKYYGNHKWGEFKGETINVKI